MASTVYDSDATMLEARTAYFERNGFGSDGGYDDAWVRVELAGLPVRFPNTASRKRAVRYHDLHHVVTGYATDMPGESEISAWELASNCRGFIAAWVLNAGAFSYGLLACPRRVRLAFIRGRHTQNLYGRRFDAALLSTPVGQLRRELGLHADALARPLPASASDRVAFALAVLVCLGAPLALVISLVSALWMGLA